LSHVEGIRSNCSDYFVGRVCPSRSHASEKRRASEADQWKWEPIRAGHHRIAYTIFRFAGAVEVTDELAPYFQEAASWDIDRAAQTVRRERVAWSVAAGAGVCVVALGCALALMVPLKTVQPYVIRVDNSTGIVDIVPMFEGHATIGETVDRYLLTHYVTVCERFSYATAEQDYQECGAYHTSKRNQDWYNQWNQTNPDSPLNVNRDGSVIRAQVTAISFFRKANGVTDIAQVRYLKARRAPGGAEHITHWIATVEYAWGTPSREVRSRQWNPLGWRVIDFRPEPESLADTSTVSPSTTP